MMETMFQEPMVDFLSKNELIKMSSQDLDRIKQSIKDTFIKRIKEIQRGKNTSHHENSRCQPMLITESSIQQHELEHSCPDQSLGELHETENVKLSYQVSSYRVKRMEQQRQLERLRQIKDSEQREMKVMLDKEREAFLALEESIQDLQKNIRFLKRRNRLEKIAQKRLDFLVNRQF
jgi:hypothetical protein